MVVVVVEGVEVVDVGLEGGSVVVVVGGTVVGDVGSVPGVVEGAGGGSKAVLPPPARPPPDSSQARPDNYCSVWLYGNGGQVTGIVEQYLP